MFPRTNKFFKPNLIIDTKSASQKLPKDRLQLNKSTQLPQSRKISLNQFSVNNA